MMKFNEYNPGSCNCVVRSLSKILGESFELVEKELIVLANDMKHDNYTNIEVFEKYMEINNIIKEKNSFENTQIKNLNLSNGMFIIFCWDKKDFYHLVSIVDKVIYDKNKDSLNLYPINIYKKVLK